MSNAFKPGDVVECIYEDGHPSMVLGDLYQVTALRAWDIDIMISVVNQATGEEVSPVLVGRFQRHYDAVTDMED